ncbi:TldD/PmbA family protein [Candidatus Sumerlaeota bacterium]|nr:TldD/PmbA family protein [Candidatus Sumerlaeota bacterium]
MDRSLIEEALDAMDSHGCDYGDIRLEYDKTESITIKGEKPEVIRQAESMGYGIRIFTKGGWGFASSSDLTRSGIVRACRKALEIARASRKAPSRNMLYQPPPGIRAQYATPCKRDPFSVSLEEKLALLCSATRIMSRKNLVKIAKGFADSSCKNKIFASTRGSWIEQEIITCGGGILATAIKDGEVQSRSYPTSFRGNFATAGWEFVQSLELEKNAAEVASEAAALIEAKECPVEDQATIILGSDQLALQIHESIGHPIELDRVFGQEASYAGTSFLNPEMLGSFRYASPEVTILADATTPMGLGSFGYDDEGTPAQCVPIIEKGILRNFLTSCGTAPYLKGKKRSNGAARAESWENIPIVRMTNINMEPGTWDFKDLISDTRKGYLLQTNKSWSIDDKRINFQFGVEAAWEIKNGKIGRLFKNPVYTGVTPEFWNSCDAVCHADYWELWGIPNCGKGEPSQTMHVGHGTAPARFTKVQLGPAK